MNKMIGTINTVPNGKFPTIKPNSTLGKIIQSLYDTYDPFIKTLKCHKNPNLSSEKSLVQEFIIQNDIQLRKYTNSLRIEKEYADNFYKTKGIPDFAYLPIEEGVSHEPIFIVEAKILPAPDHTTQREKEYVIGHNNNGGIERFKIGKHGIGVDYCGIVGFISDNNTTDTWINRINSWIIELSNEENSIWSYDEILKIKNDSKQIQSIAKSHRRDIYLYHFLIKL